MFSTVEQLEDHEMYKYVQLSDGTFRFSSIHTLPDHCRMLDRDKETPISAGMIVLKPDSLFYYESYGSTTLNLQYVDDAQELSRILGRRAASKFDF